MCCRLTRGDAASKVIEAFRLSTLNAQPSPLNSEDWTLDVGRWALGVFSNPESEGCLVALAVFKTVVVTQVAR